MSDNWMDKTLNRKLSEERWRDMDQKSRALGGPGLPPYVRPPTSPHDQREFKPEKSLSSRNKPRPENPADTWRRGQ
jgi:hypothetical protein